MTDKQKEQILKYRNKGFTYKQISRMMDLSITSVSSYCKRHTAIDENHCQFCGCVLGQSPGKRKKRFCSDKCRMAWWNTHPDQVNRKANYECTCLYCQKKFISYGNKNRKYCCHEHYINDRFGGNS